MPATPPCFRHAAICAAAVILSAALIGPVHAQRAANTTLNLPIELPTGQYALQTAAATTAVMAIAAPPDAPEQLYFAQRSGRILVYPEWPNGIAASQAFLDISSRVTTPSENGLLGLAFHPRYATNGYVYIFYTTNASGRATNRLSRFARSETDPLRADLASERILIDQIDDAGNHNGGDIHFGPDGYLYVALGDEGGGNDSYSNSQRIDRDFFAGMLRLDVDRQTESIAPTRHAAIPLYDGAAAFAIPPDNPLVAAWQEGGSDPESDLRLEFYAIGLRNPWRFAFDPATGELWVADVGQGSREEIDIVSRGGNYGWATREGMIAGPKSQTPPAGFGDFIDPIYDYGRSFGYSVTGGVVYRGAALPELYGAYIFADFGSGNIFALRRGAAGEAAAVSIIAQRSGVFEIGTDPANGDVLFSSSSRAIERLVRGDGSSAPAFPEKLSETGAFQNLDTLEPHPGILAYEPALSFWSDYATKQRWFSIPASQTIGYNRDEPWTFPAGSVWIKHFELEMERGNPATRQRVETRFLVKTEHGAYGLSYQWDEAGADATLAPPEGATIDYAITVDGEARSQTWTIPSRQQCLSCHTPAAGFALSFSAGQLNHDGPIGGEPAQNQLAYLSSHGFFDTVIEDVAAEPRLRPPDDTTVGLETRARSYLAVNCAACHRPNGGAPLTWDARWELPIEETGLINGVAANDGGDPTRRLVIRSDPEGSVLLHRVAGTSGFARMPPIGSIEPDPEGIRLLTNWISLQMPSGQSFAEWQIEHFGATDHTDAAPTRDPDGDGASNRLEYLNRTLPLDPSSVWRPVFSQGSTSLTIRFPMSPGRQFTIQASDNLAAWTDWPVPGNPPESDPLEALEAEISGPIADPDSPDFFRVVVDE